jgi:hypothetical protein
MDNRFEGPGGRPDTGAPEAGPWGSPTPQGPAGPARGLRHTARDKQIRLFRLASYIALFGVTGTAIYRDLSRPEAWAYWKDLYLSPSLSAAAVPNAFPGADGRRHLALAVSGKIGAAAAGWFRDRLDEAHLTAGDAVVLSSPGGDLMEALIMGEVIRARGLETAVGTFDSSGHLRPSYCASACILAFAGGQIRTITPGSLLGVHRFKTIGTGRDPVADAQSTTGIVLNYMTKMGVSPAIVEAMSATDDVHWLGAQEARDMKLVTGPLGER